MEDSTKTPARKPRAKKVETPLFNELSAKNVNGKTENRNGFTYLSWAWAWSEFKKHCPDAQYEVIKTDQGKPYIVDEFGILVQTKVTTGNKSHEMWLPVMDNSNNAQKAMPYEITYRNGRKITVQPASMMDINKAIMRCFVKNLAMFGLGIYIYAGEDLPDANVAPIQKPTPPVAKPTPPANTNPGPTKEKLTAKRFNDALEQIKKGNFHEEKLREKFVLSASQENNLVEFLKNQQKVAQDIKEQLKNKK